MGTVLGVTADATAAAIAGLSATASGFCAGGFLSAGAATAVVAKPSSASATADVLCNRLIMRDKVRR